MQNGEIGYQYDAPQKFITNLLLSIKYGWKMTQPTLNSGVLSPGWWNEMKDGVSWIVAIEFVLWYLKGRGGAQGILIGGAEYIFWWEFVRA